MRSLLCMALCAMGACNNTLDPMVEDMPVTERVTHPAPTPPSQKPKVYLEPAPLSTNVPSDSISGWVEE